VFGQLVLPAIVMAKFHIFLSVVVLDVDAKVGIPGVWGKFIANIAVLGGITTNFGSK